MRPLEPQLTTASHAVRHPHTSLRPSSGPGRTSLLRLAVETIDSRCVYDCAYCPFARSNGHMARRALHPRRLLADARALESLGYDWMILQMGQNPRALIDVWIPWIERVHVERPSLRLMAAVGDQEEVVLRDLRHAGVSAFWLSTECSDAGSFTRLKPSGRLDGRRRAIQIIRDSGADLVTGLTVGLPGVSHDQTFETVREAISFEPSMVGVSIYVPGEGTRCSRAKPAPEVLVREVISAFRDSLPKTSIFAGCPIATQRPLDVETLVDAGADGILVNVDGLPTQVRLGRLQENSLNEAG